MLNQRATPIGVAGAFRATRRPEEGKTRRRTVRRRRSGGRRLLRQPQRPMRMRLKARASEYAANAIASVRAGRNNAHVPQPLPIGLTENCALLKAPHASVLPARAIRPGGVAFGLGCFQPRRSLGERAGIARAKASDRGGSVRAWRSRRLASASTRRVRRRDAPLWQLSLVWRRGAAGAGAARCGLPGSSALGGDDGAMLARSKSAQPPGVSAHLPRPTGPTTWVATPSRKGAVAADGDHRAIVCGEHVLNASSVSMSRDRWWVRRARAGWRAASATASARRLRSPPERRDRLAKLLARTGSP